MHVKRHFEIDLTELSTPSQEWVCLVTGEIDRSVVERAEQHRFDQIPVLSVQGELCGIVSTKSARALLDSSQHLSPRDSMISIVQVEARPHLFSLLDVLAKHRTIFFQSSSDVADSDLNLAGWRMTTISDLNRHSFRAHLYPIFAELESLVAAVVAEMFDNHWDWLKHLDTGPQANVIGHWEIAKRNSVDTHVVNGCTLTELLKVASKDEQVRMKFHFESKGKFDKNARRIGDFRNKIMHPVRLLILNQADVAELHETLDAVVKMTVNAAEWLASSDAAMSG